MSIASWGEFGPTLENVVSLTKMPLYGVRNDMGMVLGEEDEAKLYLLTLYHSIIQNVWQVYLCLVVADVL